MIKRMDNLNLICEEENIRIDRYLSSHSDLSRSFIQKLSEEGKFTVNGKVVKSSYKVSLNDEIHECSCINSTSRMNNHSFRFINHN